jgi:hypothetical protein
MFAYLRSNPGAKYRFIAQSIANNMRVHVRNQRPLLTGLDPSNANIAGTLADIYMRELACAIKTLQHVNYVAGRYHEDAFDNTDAYIDGQMPTQSQEMNADQRHAAQLLLGVGNSFSEVNATLRMLDSQMPGSLAPGSFQAAMECTPEMHAKLWQQFRADASFAEDAFDRLHHLIKQVWSLVNLLAFSNLFRFASRPMVLPTPEDSIFIPYIPTQSTQSTQSFAVEPESGVCRDCSKPFAESYHSLTPIEGPTFHLCVSCNFKRENPDECRAEGANEEGANEEGAEEGEDQMYQMSDSDVEEELSELVYYSNQNRRRAELADHYRDQNRMRMQNEYY